VKPEHQPTHINTFGRGANTDDEKEIIGAKAGTGEYIDAVNGRPTSNTGNTGSHEKIKGEAIVYQANNANASDYHCIGSCSVNGQVIEFWADKTAVLPTLVRVNGVVVLESLLFDYQYGENFQLDKNENCIGGEVFITNQRTPPMILSVKDMVDSLISDPTKYFTGFDPLLYEVNLATPLDIPVFIELVNVGGGGGLPVGEYQYSMRYTSETGDRTNWGSFTPPIPVVQNLDNDSRIYPYAKTYGGAADPTSKTRYAIKLRFRVTNIFNYDYIEIKRTPYNAGAGIGYTPDSILIAKVQIGKGEVSVRDFLDPVEQTNNEVVSANDDTRQIAYINSAKSLRYFDRRLVMENVTIASKESALTFEQVNAKNGFEVIENLSTAGYSDPYNHTYKKSYPRGEKCGFGIELFDGVGGKGFVTKVPDLENFEFPNRRDPVDSDTQLYSYGGCVTAAATDNVVGLTHEVFDLTTETAKSNECDFKNIIRSDGALGFDGTKSKADVTQVCNESDGEIENHGAKVSALNRVSAAYHPFTPVRAGDSDVTGHDYVVNTGVATDQTESGPNVYSYRPRGFAPKYYAQGMLLAGVDNFPTWAKAFSIVRTDVAKRFVAQGLGTYALVPADVIDPNALVPVYNSLATKETNKVWFFSPDIENGIVSSDVINDLIANPQNYEVQFVSPLGFFSEFYSAEDSTISQADRLIDMISYARVIRDEDGGQINPGEDGAMGIDGFDGNRYIGYGKWRNTAGSTPQVPATFSGPDQGNTIFTISQAKRISEGRGNYIEIEFASNIYGAGSVGGTTERDFEDDGMKAWTEPVYIINIINNGANVPNNNIDSYRQTGHYQKIESIIGEGNGLANQKYILVDERWEDVIPHYDSTYAPLASIPRYIYIKDTVGVEQKWLNVTFLTAADINTIQAAITGTGSYTGAFGTGVQGMYTHEVVDSNGNPPTDANNRFFNIVFNTLNYYPSQNYKIIIKYDKTAPIRFFGGDTIIGESLFAPIDREGDAKDTPADTQFNMSIGFPYRHWEMNPRYYTIRDAASAINTIQDKEWFYLGYVRQLCMMFTVESKCSTPYAFNLDYPLQYFPLINYVIRPNRWDEEKSIVDNGIYQDYVDDYGETEKDRWAWGGFRFIQNINPDYSALPPKEYFSKPDFGFTEQTEFCTRIMWSLPRAINAQDSPGLKTFPANNSFDIDDNQGEIKFAFDATTGRGENLYAFTEKGICLLVTNKAILSDLNAGELGYMAADSFVKQQYWISRNIGMNDQMWRTAVASFMPVASESGSEVRYEGLIFANANSVFRFLDNTVTDIGRIKYHSRLFQDCLNVMAVGYTADVFGGYDEYFQEYYLYVKNQGPHPEVDNVFVFSQRNNRWIGTFDYKFDRITTVNSKTYGHRDLETYELNSGYEINGANIEYSLTACASPEQFNDKEFIRIRINTKDGTQKPTRVEFYKEVDGALQCFLDSSQGPLYLKNYRGWEQFIPRILASVDANRPRLQQRLIVFVILHNLATDFKVIDTGIMYKNLK